MSSKNLNFEAEARIFKFDQSRSFIRDFYFVFNADLNAKDLALMMCNGFSSQKEGETLI